MPTPSVVRIDGKDVPDVDSVEFLYNTPTEGGYLRSVTPDFGTIVLTRGATARPAVNLFGLATNNDGTRKTFEGNMTLVDDEGQDIYSVSFKDAFVEHWSMGQTSGDPRGRETVILRVGELQFFAGPNNAVVNFRNYKG